MTVTRIGLWFATLALIGCAQTQVAQLSPLESMPAKEYAALIAKNTGDANQYSGFNQTFQASVTIMTAEVQAAVLRQRAVFKGWDQRQYQAEHEKAVQDASAYSHFALRLFTSDKDYDDADKPKTIWKTYLEINGSRFEGTVKKMKDRAIELQTLFPHTDKFSTVYDVSFSVPMTTVEQGRAKFILTSGMGGAEFTFPTGK
jgi:hypothetical protein